MFAHSSKDKTLRSDKSANIFGNGPISSSWFLLGNTVGIWQPCLCLDWFSASFSRAILGKLTSLCVPGMVAIHWWAFCNYWASTTNTRRPPKGVYKLMHSENIHLMHTLDLVLVACPEQWWLRTGGLMAAKKESSHSPTRAAPPSSCGSSDWLSTLSTSTIFHNKPDLLTLWLAFTLSHVSQCTSHTLVSPF